MNNKVSGKRPGPVVLDVVGKQLNAEDERRIAHPLTGGVILFARNFESRAQLVTLTRAIRAVRDDVLICIDHEGGRVQRAKTDGFTHLPAMAKLGQLWDRDVLMATKAAIACGYVLAAELRACDIDLSFTPVLDLDFGRSGVIGDRAFHADPRVVTMLANHLTHGLLLAGMTNCGKHFPGHGYVEADSHVAVPVDERTLDEILAHDARPYDWMGPALASVMPAHVIYPKVDPAPAGFSRFWLQDILRAQLGFEGVIFSDDLSMEGASVAGTVTQGAKAALDAGCDMVLICNNPEKADQLLTELDTSISKTSQRRIRKLFGRRKPLDWNKLEQEGEYRAALRLLRDLGLVK
ncbi:MULTISPECIES: beta-N-acetylhexosaminidase [unclassified Cupriavidus]|uniref:beta-N-acetylhexosaminidase n=1 Tax=unclassified Cupriavidus TaxID=2640874 RepID=UPI001BFFEB70|nr:MULTISPECIES: beta-N-acetylhexosaminidase [unclassified Cupriavidus]MCA3184659.1 beta-N-acetylhexosaminidase [Cupriavidus sp.]MCA3190991.1 beta-N-acetylhexosaminidase [Cupriavidus sp.]MCA3199335.1 beta-N-acetylhexosaminidase [Cupriavidus sp.]MCA3204602.1 beta-N-acetylhexosaminidase [Cupriavidus sp.]MCA3209030.1 beta-N-acetylhexosaminidase [Cupriavidus sp.]